jgi:hypothetical protein
MTIMIGQNNFTESNLNLSLLKSNTYKPMINKTENTNSFALSAKDIGSEMEPKASWRK